MSNDNQLVTGKCHKCGSIRQVIGKPPTCPKCLKHYRANLHRRTLRQMKREGKVIAAAPGDGNQTVQEMFNEAVKEQMEKAKAGTFVVDEAAAIPDSVVADEKNNTPAPGTLHDMAIRSGREIGKPRLANRVFAEMLDNATADGDGIT